MVIGGVGINLNEMVEDNCMSDWWSDDINEEVYFADDNDFLSDYSNESEELEILQCEVGKTFNRGESCQLEKILNQKHAFNIKV